MKRIAILVEGQTEEQFVSRVMQPHLDARGARVWLTWVIAAAMQRRDLLGEPEPAQALQSLVDEFGGNVELINDGPRTAPSKRVLEAWPQLLTLNRACSAAYQSAKTRPTSSVVCLTCL